MGTLSTHLEVKYTADLSTGPNHITDSNFSVTLPMDAGITEYSPKTLKPNLNDLSNPFSRFEIENIATFLYLQANRRMQLVLNPVNEEPASTIFVDRVFYIVAPFTKVSIINPDQQNNLLIKIVYS